MRTKAVTGIALTMLLLVVVSPIAVPVGVVDSDGESGDIATQSGVDWWPMFHHDLHHTGYSTSTAPNTNNTIWSYTTDAWLGRSSPAVADGKVYVKSADRKVYCLSAATGDFIWSYATGCFVSYSSPAVADGMVYVGSNDLKVYCLNASADSMTPDEREIWNYTTGHFVQSSPAVADGMVYVGSEDRKVYAFGPPPPPPYDVTIEAHCYTEGIDVGVSIIKDGSPTPYTTPHTFTS